MSARGRVVVLRFTAVLKHKWDAIFFALFFALMFLLMGEEVAAFLAAAFGISSAVKDFLHEHEVRVLRTALDHARRRPQ